MSFPFTDEELKSAVLFNLDKIKPAIQKDGGDIKFIDVVNAVVFVQLQGACVGCASSNVTIKNLVEKHLREYIHPELVVKNTPQGMEDKLDQL
ncbi:MAG: NifU family protein [Campylobacterales bacterium]|nr:NifU family protein [Campylobacterales bacterium]